MSHPDRFTTTVDPEAEPVDFDRMIARFLLNFVRTVGAPATDADSQQPGAED